ncbi:hypothetical protein KP509_23G068800 [Ceratopteris richardii]|uniref:ethanolamine kinase n=1 Tax=Ceratopteris richardii TaxID=49495 RepID=A0A8T2S0Q9_CERRI|nr:hypothetical protein KP509_23G068800 [Ceratopteris richardii]
MTTCHIIFSCPALHLATRWRRPCLPWKRMGYNVKTDIAGLDSGIPSCDLFIDPSLPPNLLHGKVRNVCRTLVKKWSLAHDDELSVSRVSGGITNLLLKVSIKSNTGRDDSVTVRIFGPNTDEVIDRKRELQAIRPLSDAGFGAMLLGVFQNGMVQSFINARTLTPSEMTAPHLASLIAKELRRLHNLDMPGAKDAQLWIDISRLLEKASNLSFDDHLKQQSYETISFKQLREEVRSLKEASHLLNAPVVFCHNDLLSGNFMYSDAEDEIYLIDFEYGSYNYRGFDIGNHFAEYAGFDCDYDLYPDENAQFHFFRYYLNADDPNSVSQAELEKLYVEVNFFSLASHLFWAVWAIVQSKYSSIDFDYLSYYFLRWKEYQRRKAEFMSLLRVSMADLS